MAVDKPVNELCVTAAKLQLPAPQQLWLFFNRTQRAKAHFLTLSSIKAGLVH